MCLTPIMVVAMTSRGAEFEKEYVLLLHSQRKEDQQDNEQDRIESHDDVVADNRTPSAPLGKRRRRSTRASPVAEAKTPKVTESVDKTWPVSDERVVRYFKSDCHLDKLERTVSHDSHSDSPVCCRLF